MKTPALVLAVALVATASPTLAQTDPGGRIQELTYAPNGVYPISGAFRTATQIIFSPEETIRHAAIGDSVAWEVAAEGSVLFLKPRERHQSTNLLVVTERAGVARHYVFELLAQDRSARTAAYQVRFRYPDDDQARAAAALAVSAQAAEERLIGLELQAGAIEGRRNLAYSVQGDPRDRFPRLIEQRRLDGDPLPRGATTALTDFCSSGENTFASIRQSITTRMGLWLNPLVDAATSASDFDLRTIRNGRLSLYLAASPENMDRVAPLYALLFQQLVDLNSRDLPAPDAPRTLVLLDEFARLGRAPVLAHAFAWVAGYGLRLLPVVQSPSQLRALYGPDVTEDILTNCGLEIVFAPKELKVAQELSERLGYYTYRARSRSRPIGLGQGRRSLTDSDQKRALMLPQELMQLSGKALIVLKAGLSPTRGRKLVFYRDRRFTARLRPPPETAPAPPPPLAAVIPKSPVIEEPDMDFDSIVRRFAAEGLRPPAPGASEAEVQAWLDRVVAAPATARAPLERRP